MPRSERSRRRWVLVAVAVGLVLAGYGVMFAPFFHVRTVVVVGAHRLSREEVASIAGIGAGENILYADLSAAASRLRDEPWVEEATVTRDLPSTIRISILERRAVGLATIDGREMVVTDDGQTVPSEATSELPVVRGVLGRDGAGLEAAATVLRAMTPRLRSRFTEVVVRHGGSVVLVLASGAEVEYGPPTRTGAKTQALRSLLTWADEEGIEVARFDVRVPSAPTATPQGVAS